MKNRSKDYLIALFLALFAALVVRNFVLEAYRIPSLSMSPTLLPGDFLFVYKWPFGYRLPGFDTPIGTPRAPEKGEVIVYLKNGGRTHSIKRVVGVGGDDVSILDGRVFINGKTLEIKEQSSPTCGIEIHGKKEYPVCIEPPLPKNVQNNRVPRGRVFLVNDYRTFNTDVEVYQEISIDQIVGSAEWIFLSLEPQKEGESFGWFPKFRLDRMFKAVP